MTESQLCYAGSPGRCLAILPGPLFEHARQGEEVHQHELGEAMQLFCLFASVGVFVVTGVVPLIANVVGPLGKVSCEDTFIRKSFYSTMELFLRVWKLSFRFPFDGLKSYIERLTEHSPGRVRSVLHVDGGFQVVGSYIVRKVLGFFPKSGTRKETQQSEGSRVNGEIVLQSASISLFSPEYGYRRSTANPAGHKRVELISQRRRSVLAANREAHACGTAVRTVMGKRCHA